MIRPLVGYKVLVFILYGVNDSAKVSPLGEIELQIGPVARALKIPNYRLRDHLSWLADNLYITDLKMTYGKAFFKIYISPMMMRIIPSEEIK